MDNLATTTSETATCPFRPAETDRLEKADVLVLAAPKRMVLQYMTTNEGRTELVLFYGGKEITFDEPHLFTFGETLARQSRFAAGDALTWGDDLDWNEVRDCLASLRNEGILVDAEDAPAPSSPAAERGRPCPLSPAEAHAPASWNDLEAITQRLAGRAVEPGWLELVVPVFRVAHMALDADDRQVGEANVFPRALRLDRPTEWMACTYAGTRYLDPKPMNVTAMKAMRAHWTEMMMALATIRDAYLARYPGLDEPLSIGAIERLATLVLALPTYQLVKPVNPVASGELHPALSSLFRVTDGLRLVMHMMLFVPAGEPTLPPWKPVTIDQILDYAERNFAFHSETGVCAGPRHFVRTFLEVLVEGKRPEAPADFAFSPQVAAALAEIDTAFDYGLEALRAHAALFAIWPATARCYDRMAEAVAGLEGLGDLDARLQDHLVTMAHSTYLGSEAWRRNREAAYADMFNGCSAGLGESGDLLTDSEPGDCAPDIARILAGKLDPEAAASLAVIIAQFAREAQVLLAIAVQCQARLNARLGRPAPRRPFSVEDLNVHVRMQGERPGKRLPFLIDELKSLFGLSLVIEAGHIHASATEQMLPH